LFSILNAFILCMLKPKFHYADFATFTETTPLGKSRTQIMKVRDTNHVADFHDLCPRLCRELVLDFVADFPRAS